MRRVKGVTGLPHDMGVGAREDCDEKASGVDNTSVLSDRTRSSHPVLPVT